MVQQQPLSNIYHIKFMQNGDLMRSFHCQKMLPSLLSSEQHFARIFASEPMTLPEIDHLSFFSRACVDIFRRWRSQTTHRTQRMRITSLVTFDDFRVLVVNCLNFYSRQTINYALLGPVQTPNVSWAQTSWNDHDYDSFFLFFFFFCFDRWFFVRRFAFFSQYFNRL